MKQDHEVGNYFYNKRRREGTLNEKERDVSVVIALVIRNAFWLFIIVVIVLGMSS